jgi:hypothetical protein
MCYDIYSQSKNHVPVYLPGLPVKDMHILFTFTVYIDRILRATIIVTFIELKYNTAITSKKYKRNSSTGLKKKDKTSFKHP